MFFFIRETKGLSDLDKKELYKPFDEAEFNQNDDEDDTKTNLSVDI